MASRLAALLQQQPRDPATEAVEDMALHALASAAALAAAQHPAADAESAAGDINSKSSYRKGTAVASGVSASMKGAASANGKASPFDPEFEHLLSTRVAAIMHRGLQLACGLGAITDTQHTAGDGCSPEQPGKDVGGADELMEVSTEEGLSLIHISEPTRPY